MGHLLILTDLCNLAQWFVVNWWSHFRRS